MCCKEKANHIIGTPWKTYNLYILGRICWMQELLNGENMSSTHKFYQVCKVGYVEVLSGLQRTRDLSVYTVTLTSNLSI